MDIPPVRLGPAPSTHRRFPTSDLHFLWSAPLPEQQKAGWCAIDSNGVLLSSNGRVTPRVHKDEGPLFRYRIHEKTLTLLDRVVLRDEQGTPVVLDSMQGGTFADDHHLYVSCGYYEKPHPSWGLHLFDMRTKRRIVRSTNGSGSFNYEFHSGNSFDEEPEGLTYWDLDGRDAPGIRDNSTRSCSTTTRTATTCTSSTIESKDSDLREKRPIRLPR